MRLPVVDENDVVIGFKEGGELLPEDTYRVSALWVVDSAGRCLLAQRALTKKHSPGKWGPAVAGTVEEGEDYESNILKEIQEELGISLTTEDLQIGPKTHRTPPTSSAYFTQWYFALVTKDLDEFTYPESEVMGLRWLTEDELRRAMTDEPDHYLPSLHESLDLLVAEADPFRSQHAS